MKIDELLAALAIMRQRLMVIDGPYSADQAQERLRFISYMRDAAWRGDVQEFTDYIQRHLAGPDGDTMSDLLEELWEELGMDSLTAVWEDFEQQFLQ